MAAEVTSAKFIKLRSQGKIESKTILKYMMCLEEELGGSLYTD